MKPLNDKEQLFVSEYLIDLNATQAAIRAGYAEKTADAKAYKWVGKSRADCPKDKLHVWDAVQEAMKSRTERIKVDADYVLMRLTEIDQMDVTDILEDDGRIKLVKEWPKVWRTSISAIDVSELLNAKDSDDLAAVVKKIKWPDKVKNLELIGKHVDVQSFRERMKHEGALVIFDNDYGDED